MGALSSGSSIRQADATAANAQSSRSHAVFSLNLVQRKSKGTQNLPIDKRFSVPPESVSGIDGIITVDSKLHFVDLAGSERLKNSGLTGERAKEGISINAGLASLGKVISQLSSRSPGSHVSYRDSKLTRLLQDSLGGNAITYMVACVIPVEFHLSETLNTVQYAQRARAIQTKPQIQQRMDDGDKQLMIERLRAEVALLRDQVRLSGRSERAVSQNTGKKQERETELLNQLLDMQENYTSLSQRHAKLISEAANINGDVADVPALRKAMHRDSRERLNDARSFAEAVEEVVLEYEKTIQSLESSLSNARSSLSTSETNLLEREARIVYMDAVTQQLQARIQKSVRREADNEQHMQGLEAKLEGVNNGEEKHMIIIKDLRKELARIHESESNAEDYISTLEERLAEAQQDMEVMQQEVRRLEHVVERQRTVGKLSVQDDSDKVNVNGASKNGETAKKHMASPSDDMFHDRLLATTTSVENAHDEQLPENAEEEWKTFGPMEGETDDSDEEDHSHSVVRRGSPEKMKRKSHHAMSTPHANAVTKVLSDKLETVTIELFDLKVDHESTLSELNDVNRKYHIALKALSELQDAVDEAQDGRSPPFSETPAMRDHNDYGRHSSSRFVSMELSSLGGGPPTLTDASDTEVASVGASEDKHVARAMMKQETLAESIRSLKRANAEKDINMAELAENYSQLQDQHNDTLNYIEELEEELRRSNNAATPQLLRSRASQYGAVNVGHVQNLESELAALREKLSTKDRKIVNLEKLRAARNGITSNVQNDEMNELEAQLAAMERELSETKASFRARDTKASEIEKAHNLLVAEAKSNSKRRDALEREVQNQRKMVSTLEDQIDQQKSLVNFHQQGAKSMQESHAREIEEVRNTHSLQPSYANASATALFAAHKNVMDLEEKVKQLTTQNEKTSSHVEESESTAQKATHRIQELEEQLKATLEKHQDTNKRLSAAQKSRADVEREFDEYRNNNGHAQSVATKRLTPVSNVSFSSRPDSGNSFGLSTHNEVRKSASHQTLPASPPPDGPLPALPRPPQSNGPLDSNPTFSRALSPPGSATSRHMTNQTTATNASMYATTNAQLEESTARARTLEKHLYAEKQLTQTLEEALVELETSGNGARAELESFRRRCAKLEDDVRVLRDEGKNLRRERGEIRVALQAAEEERERRSRAEVARRQLEEMMEARGGSGGGSTSGAVNGSGGEKARKKKSKGGTLNCF